MGAGRGKGAGGRPCPAFGGASPRPLDAAAEARLPQRCCCAAGAQTAAKAAVPRPLAPHRSRRSCTSGSHSEWAPTCSPPLVRGAGGGGQGASGAAGEGQARACAQRRTRFDRFDRPNQPSSRPPGPPGPASRPGAAPRSLPPHRPPETPPVHPPGSPAAAPKPNRLNDRPARLAGALLLPVYMNVVVQGLIVFLQFLVQLAFMAAMVWIFRPVRGGTVFAVGPCATESFLRAFWLWKSPAPMLAGKRLSLTKPSPACNQHQNQSQTQDQNTTKHQHPTPKPQPQHQHQHQHQNPYQQTKNP